MKKDIRIIGKKTLACLLGVSMVVGTFLSVPYKAKAAGTQSIPIKVTYGQSEARTMLASINNLRTDASQAWAYDESNNKVSYPGLGELQYDYGLEKIAMKRAVEIALSYDHTRPNGNKCFTAYDDFEWRARGENIAAGQSSAYEVFTAWKEENEKYAGQGHRRNMLSSNYCSVGIGHVKFDGTDYWVQEFSSPSTEVSDDGANESTSVENIETSDDYIQGMKADRSSISLKKGDTVDLSDMKIMLLINNHYSTYGEYGKYCTTESDYEASVDDSSIAEYKDGKLTGLGAGKTTLVISAYGRTCDVEINVEELAGGEKPVPTPDVTETPAVTPTPIATETPAETPTPIATETPAVAPTPIATETPVVTPTPIATETPAVTPTPDTTEKPEVVPTPTPAVTEKPQEKVPVTSMKIAASGKLHLVVTGKDGKNNNASVKWQSDNTKYATINSDGVVKFKKAGIGKTVVMTATSKSDNRLVKKVKIKILKNVVTGIKIKNPPKTLKAGKSVTLKSVVKTSGKDANKSLTWYSSNSKYLTVNSKGKIVANKAGKGKTVYVYAAATDGSGKKVKIKIKIK